MPETQIVWRFRGETGRGSWRMPPRPHGDIETATATIVPDKPGRVPARIQLHEPPRERVRFVPVPGPGPSRA